MKSTRVLISKPGLPHGAPLSFRKRDNKSKTYAAEVGDRLRQAREAAGYSQAQFARLLKITQQRMTHYESGNNRVMPDLAREIYLRTGITADWLYLGKPDTLPGHIRDVILSREE